MNQDTSTDRDELLALTVEIVSAYAGNNVLGAAALPDLIGAVFAKLNELAANDKSLPATLTPAVPIKRSVMDDHIVCFEDAKKLKMLKRHLMIAYDMTPEEYRAKWGLKHDYAMVAPAYAAKRQEIAKRIGVGRKPRAPQPAPEPAKKTRRRKKAAA